MKQKAFIDNPELWRAVDVLHDGGVVAVATETYYGLAVDPFNLSALERLFSIKGRPDRKPVLVLLGAQEDVDRVVAHVPPQMKELMGRWWPGALTLIMPARPLVPERITAGTGTIGVRLSGCQEARQLASAFGGVITGTSANLSGGRPATSAAEVRALFGDAVELILDGGTTVGGAGSTLVGTNEAGHFTCLRQGCIPFEDIVAPSPEIDVF
ncbi:MAG: threonylcarbamoyl-AMP synthase [Desulfobulbus propionicus]|nr:MAG: threonylcarbamoyl-AMP synthase [Desulfobulbus propionicus]